MAAANDIAPASSEASVSIEVAAFSRQASLSEFDDELISRQVCMVVGSGGVGSCVGLTLARLGVQHISFFDYDTVAGSNLNRQLLFSAEHVGMAKATACKLAVERTHAIRTSASAINGNAVTQWSNIVKEAEHRGATAIFNGCDYGGFFDAATQSLALSLRVPYTAASTYAYTYQVDSFGGQVGDACAVCTMPPEHPLCWKDLSRGKEEEGRGGGDDAPITIEEVLEVLKREYRSDHPLLPGMVRDAFKEASASAAGPEGDGGGGGDDAGSGWELLPRTQSSVLRLKRALGDATLARLAPSKIRGYDSIAFIPKDPVPHTASVGSWVAVCAIGSMFAVNSWVQRLAKQDVPEMTINYINARTGEDWRSSMTWEGMKFHNEPTDGCPLCGYEAPKPETAEAPAPEPPSAPVLNTRMIVCGAAVAGLLAAVVSGAASA